MKALAYKWLLPRKVLKFLSLVRVFCNLSNILEDRKQDTLEWVSSYTSVCWDKWSPAPFTLANMITSFSVTHARKPPAWKIHRPSVPYTNTLYPVWHALCAARAWLLYKYHFANCNSTQNFMQHNTLIIQYKRNFKVVNCNFQARQCLYGRIW